MIDAHTARLNMRSICQETNRLRRFHAMCMHYRVLQGAHAEPDQIKCLRADGGGCESRAQIAIPVAHIRGTDFAGAAGADVIA